MRFETVETAPNLYSVLDTKRGKYHVINESIVVCDNVCAAMNGGKLRSGVFDVLECDEIARHILERTD